MIWIWGFDCWLYKKKRHLKMSPWAEGNYNRSLCFVWPNQEMKLIMVTIFIMYNVMYGSSRFSFVPLCSIMAALSVTLVFYLPVIRWSQKRPNLALWVTKIGYSPTYMAVMSGGRNMWDKNSFASTLHELWWPEIQQTYSLSLVLSLLLPDSRELSNEETGTRLKRSY